MDDKLKAAIDAVKAAPKTDIKGKQYTKVATRVEMFRTHFGLDYSLTTETIEAYDPNICRVKATISSMGMPIATGLAEEDRRQGKVNSTSALENAETSAIGRALAAFGLMGGEYASDVEMVNAFSAQNTALYDAPPQEPIIFPRAVASRQASSPKVVPMVRPVSGLFVPDTQANTTWNQPHPIVDRVIEEVRSVVDRNILSAYWSELKPFMSMLQQQAPERLSEIKAAFHTQFDHVEIQ